MCILHKFLNNFHLLWIIIVHLSMSTKDMHFVYKESGIFVMWKALESFLCVLRFFSLFKHLFQINQCWMLNDKPQLHCMQWVNKNSHFPSKSYLWRISYKIKKLLPCDEKFGFAWFNNKKDYPITHTYLTLTTFSGFRSLLIFTCVLYHVSYYAWKFCLGNGSVDRAGLTFLTVFDKMTFLCVFVFHSRCKNYTNLY